MRVHLDGQTRAVYLLQAVGAGITQSAECQLPKLKVAGSIPVARSIFFLAVSALLLTCIAPRPAYGGILDRRASDMWRLRAGLEPLDQTSERIAVRYALNSADVFGFPALPGDWQIDRRGLRRRIRSGSRFAVIPLVSLLVDEGRLEEAEMTFDLMGTDVPATRRDLAIALSWFGRFEISEVLAGQPSPPPDLREDAYGDRIAAIVELGWMTLGPDGNFNPEMMVGTGDLIRVYETFLSSEGQPWPREWIGVSELDRLFTGHGSGSDER